MPKYIKFFPLMLLALLISCKEAKDKQSSHLANVGIILKDESIDDPSFQPCHEDYSFFITKWKTPAICTMEKNQQ
jgi:hypothetical protein